MQVTRSVSPIKLDFAHFGRHSMWITWFSLRMNHHKNIRQAHWEKYAEYKHDHPFNHPFILQLLIQVMSHASLMAAVRLNRHSLSGLNSLIFHPSFTSKSIVLLCLQNTLIVYTSISIFNIRNLNKLAFLYSLYNLLLWIDI